MDLWGELINNKFKRIRVGNIILRPRRIEWCDHRLFHLYIASSEQPCYVNILLSVYCDHCKKEHKNMSSNVVYALCSQCTANVQSATIFDFNNVKYTCDSQFLVTCFEDTVYERIVLTADHWNPSLIRSSMCGYCTSYYIGGEICNKCFRCVVKLFVHKMTPRILLLSEYCHMLELGDILPIIGYAICWC